MPRTWLNYTEKQMEMALQAVEGGMSKNAAAKKYSEPRTTTVDKLSGKTPRERKIGHPTILSQEDENEIVL